MRKLILIAVLNTLLPGVARAENGLSAEELVAKVLESNPRLQAERHVLKAARSSAEAAGALEDPMIMYGVTPFAIADGRAVNAHQAEIAQTLPWFGKRGLERDMAQAQAGMQAAEARGVAQELATQSRKLFAERVRLLIVHESLREQLQSLDDLRKTTLAAIAAGKASQADALMVESEFHMLHEEQIANQAAIERVEAGIDALAGEPVHDRLASTLPAWPVDLTATTEQPEVQAAMQAREEARAAGRLSDRSALPDVTLFAGVNTMWMDRSDWVMAGVRLNLPVRQARRSAERDAAQANVHAMEQRMRATQLSRDEMRAKARADMAEARERRRLYEETAIPLAARRLAAARAAYANGQGPIDAVLQALRYEITSRYTVQLMEVMEYEAKAELAFANGTALAAGDVE